MTDVSATPIFNSALKSAALPHTAVFVATDDPWATDDEIEIRLMDQPTRFSVQIGGPRDLAINEYVFDTAGELDGLIHRGLFERGADVAAKIVSLLKGNACE